MLKKKLKWYGNQFFLHMSMYDSDGWMQEIERVSLKSCICLVCSKWNKWLAQWRTVYRIDVMTQKKINKKTVMCRVRMSENPSYPKTWSTVIPDDVKNALWPLWHWPVAPTWDMRPDTVTLCNIIKTVITHHNPSLKRKICSENALIFSIQKTLNSFCWKLTCKFF